MTDYTAPFDVSVEGDTTGERYMGHFECRTVLSFEEHSFRDRIRRELLAGPIPDAADARARSIADVLSELAARLVKWPKWWEHPRGGINGHHLMDDNVVGAVYDGAILKMRERDEERRKKLEAAKKTVADEAPKLPGSDQ